MKQSPIFLTTIVVLCTIQHTVQSKKRSMSISSKQIIEKIYKDISGFSIPNDEYDMINNKGGAATYGEITYESLETLLQELRPTKHDVFYDLGCGIGKACIQTLLTTPIKKAVGVELSPTRITHARSAKEYLYKNKILNPHKNLSFVEKNIIDADLSDATIIFMCSLCFSDQLMQEITKKILHLKSGLHVITLRKLHDEATFKLIKKYNLSMSWSNNSTVYYYQLVK